MPKASSTVNTSRAHRDLIQQLATLPPPIIVGAADPVDVETRVEHVRNVYVAMVTYLHAVITDTADRLPRARIDREKVLTALWDTADETSDSVLRDLERAGVRFHLAAAA